MYWLLFRLFSTLAVLAVVLAVGLVRHVRLTVVLIVLFMFGLVRHVRLTVVLTVFKVENHYQFSQVSQGDFEIVNVVLCCVDLKCECWLS